MSFVPTWAVFVAAGVIVLTLVGLMVSDAFQKRRNRDRRPPF